MTDWGPGLVGLAELAIYLFVAALAWRAARGAAGASRFWTGSAALVVVLGIVAAADLQVLATDAMRCVARYQGWYWEGRRPVQTVFGVAVVAILAASVAVLPRRRTVRRPTAAAATAGLTVLLGVAILTAAGQHEVDAALGAGPGALSLGAGLRLAALGLVGGAAWHDARADRRGPAQGI